MPTSNSELCKEVLEPGEAELAGKLIAALRGVIEQWYLTGLTYRDVHVKGHAAVRAEFTVVPGLPKELQVGVFKEARTFPAWIRFSNASHFPAPDIKGDIRGMAVKLMGVEGRKLLGPQQDAQTHDFIFLSTDVFLTRNATDFLKFVEAGALNYHKSLSDYLKLAWYILGHFDVGVGLLANSRKFASLLEIDWYSATPYLFSDRAVKYRLRPWQQPLTPLPAKPAHNFLRERLTADLEQRPAGFDFMIQVQRDPKLQPIENALVPWKEKDAPFEKIATLELPRQKIGSPEFRDVAENLSMNPWHCLPEHRPLGGVNRVRRDVYFGISSFRHGQNGVPVREPDPHDTNI
jgi:hypothetical protein